MLDLEQRVLLWHGLDGWLLAEAITNTDYAVSHLKSRLGGRSWPHRLMPEVPFNVVDIDKKGVTGRLDRGPVLAAVTYTQLHRWAEAVPETLKAAIRAERQVGIAERRRTENWCRCGRAEECLKFNEGDPLYGNRYHPTDAEDREHWAVLHESRERLDGLVVAALGLVSTDDAAAVGGQLELFGVAS